MGAAVEEQWSSLRIHCLSVVPSLQMVLMGTIFAMVVVLEGAYGSQ